MKLSFFFLLLAFAGCAAPAAPRALMSAAIPPAAVGHGTLLAIRPLPPIAARTLVLTALGAEGAASSTATAELIVQTDAGKILSVAQPAGGGLRVGAPVLIRFGAETVVSAR